MSSGRILNGVLEVVTSAGPVYLCPTFFERLCLAWIFRHFRILPVAVLNPRAQRLVEGIVQNRRRADMHDDILGTVDCRPADTKKNSSNLAPKEITQELVEA
ncbi:MAG TPA: hypothetical protein VN577_21835 [Terriglobales bacterium]|nr:hypothetical protein [Terriglobales bacterium]